MMPKQDDLLQNQLEALEAGKSLDSVLDEIPEESRELAPLVRLASSMRARVIPEPHFSETLVSDVCGSMRAEKAGQSKVERRSFWRDLFKPLLSPSTGRLVGATLAAVLLVVSILGFGFWFGQTREARTVTLIEVEGLVEIASGEMGQDWEEVASGQQIKKGVRIRTGADGTVTLLFYEGSRAVVGPDTDLFLTTVKGDGLRELTVAMDQQSGETAHSVVPLSGEKSAYQVHTDSGTANVHGTSFRVQIPQTGKARFVVDQGEVLVTADGKELMLTAGQVALSQPDQILDDAAYGFTLKGYLTEIGDLWVVGGVPFQVTLQTNIKGDPQVDSFVLVDGRIDGDGIWIADMVKVQKVSKEKSSFTGILESMQGPWVISGISVQVTAQTELVGSLALGDPVEVSFVVDVDGSWQALEIVSLLGEPIENPGIIIEESPTITPTATITSSETLTETLEVDCVGVDPHPEAMVLAERYFVPYEHIMGRFCQGYGFGEIDLAYELSLVSGVPVEEVFAMRESGMGWGQIKALLEPTKTPKPTKVPKPTKTPKPDKD